MSKLPWPHDPRYLVHEDGVIIGVRGHPLSVSVNVRTGRPQVFAAGKTRRVAIMVCEAFYGLRPEGAHAAHNDGDVLNSRASNLAWKTPAENYADRDRHGTTARGERNGFAVLTERAVVEIKSMYSSGGVSQHELSRLFGVSQSAVSGILTGRSWRHV